MHTGALIKEVGLKSAIVPRFPGVTSALGCVVSDLLYDRVQTVNKLLKDVDFKDLKRQILISSSELENYVIGSATDVLSLERFYEFDILYIGQTHTVVVPFELEGQTLNETLLQNAFNRAYLDSYGRLLEDIPIKIINYRVIVAGRRPSFDMSLFAPKTGKSASECVLQERKIYSNGKFWQVNVYDRLSLAIKERIPGPALLEQSDTTIFIDPGLVATVDSYGNLIITNNE